MRRELDWVRVEFSAARMRLKSRFTGAASEGAAAGLLECQTPGEEKQNCELDYP